jgi:radical SAM family uncharacterized protein/radical SAM-linked protein
MNHINFKKEILNFQQILPYVEKPSRYIGAEANIIRKNHNQIKCRIALVFPDLYEIGTSHMGIQVLYHIINQHPNALAERVFAPASDMASLLKDRNIPLASLESRTPLKNFDIIGFSLLYELNYTNILGILDLSDIPFYSSDRGNNFPVIIAGGPCTCNPEPVSDFFDALIIGDGENVIVDMIERWLNDENKDRQNVLKSWEKIDGIYVPHFFNFHPVDDCSGIRRPIGGGSNTIKRAIVSKLDEVPFPDHPVVAIGKPVHDRYSLEIARGCTRGCRFCQAGMIYRPVRERSIDTLLNLTTTALPSTGYDEISLLSLSSGDYSHIDALMSNIMSYCQHEHIAVSLPSLRAGTLTSELMAAIKKVRKTGFTIAPEAASDRLRKVINKNITEQDIIQTVSKAFEMGWQLIKLYFMIGLPTETQDDIDAIVQLVKRLLSIVRTYSKRAHINVSVSTFIPKPHTPFQWCEQISLLQSTKTIQYLKDQLNIKGIRMKWQDPKVSYMEGIFSRGDRRLSSLLVKAYEQGCQFDGWSDHFRFDLWKKAFELSGIQPEKYHLQRSLDDPLPWDHIDMRIKKQFLKDEWQKAINETQTGDCRTGDCMNCGVCDFKNIKPVSGYPMQSKFQPLIRNTEEISFQKYLFAYTKLSDVRFLGHLELVTLIIRAFRRAGFSFEHSKGFHPMPRVSFSDPLPLGIASEAEYFIASVSNLEIPEKEIDTSCISKINKQLPDGLKVIHYEKVASKKQLKLSQPKNIVYDIMVNHDIDLQKIQNFMDTKTFIVSKENRKGKVTSFDLKQCVQILLSGKRKLTCVVDNQSTQTIRPKMIVQSILGMDDQAISAAYIIKRKTE